MGCIAAKSGSGAKLDALQERIDPLVERHDNGSLIELARCAVSLKEVLSEIVANGAVDVIGIRRIERTADVILRNLEQRITQDLMRAADADRQLADIRKVAVSLDAVRATKASVTLEESITRVKAVAIAQDEVKARSPVVQLKQILGKIVDGATLASHASKVLDSAEEAHRHARESKKVAELLLKGLIELATKVMSFHKFWLAQPDRVKAMRDLATRLDALAESLVKVMEATWDPPLAPEVEGLVQSHVTQVCADVVAKVEAALADRNCGGAFDHLQALQPCWPELLHSGDTAMQVIGMFNGMKAVVCEDFRLAVRAADKPKASEIARFAAKYQGLRDGFEGLPADPDGDLPTLLKTGAKLSVLERHLDAVDAELAKPAAEGDVAAPGGSLAAMVQAIGAVATTWASVAGQAQEEHRTRLLASCAALEAWAEGAAGACDVAQAAHASEPPPPPLVSLRSVGSSSSLGQGPAGKARSLLLFAAQYDGSRQGLEGLPPPDGPLRPRVGARLMGPLLAALDGQLAGAHLDAAAVLDLLRAASEAARALPPPDGGGDDWRARLDAATDLVAKRVTSGFTEAAKVCDTRRQETLLKFADIFDKTVLPKSGDDGGHLHSTLLEMQEAALAELVRELEERMGADDPSAAIAAVASTAPWAPQLAWEPKFHGALVGALRKLVENVDSAAARAPASGHDSAFDSLLDTAQEADAALALLPAEFVVEPSLSSRISGPVAKAQCAALRAVVDGATDFDETSMTSRLSTLERVLHAPGCPPDAAKDAEDFLCGAFVDFLVSSMLSQKFHIVAALGDLARAVDRVFAGREVARASAADELEAARAPVDRLREAREECSKESGMDPRRVNGALQALVPIWRPVGRHAAFREAAAALFAAAEGKVRDACRKASVAVLAGDRQAEQKMKAVQGFADEVAKMQQSLLDASAAPFAAQDFRAAMCQVVVEVGLAHVDAELAKEKGLVPAAILAGLQHAGGVWSELPADDTCSGHRLDDVLEKVRNRMVAAYQKSVDAADSARMGSLRTFADQFDSTCEVFGERAGLASLARTLGGIDAGFKGAGADIRN